MKKQFLAFCAVLAIALMPTRTEAITLGGAVYKIAAGCGGVILGSKAIGFGLGSIILGAYATGCVVGGVVAGQPVILAFSVPCAAGSALSAALSYGCGYLSYRCFQEMLASHPEIIHVHHHHYNDGKEGDMPEQSEILQRTFA